ncbi:hypothetical protein B0H15DRAFT_931850 [Mycena belliarum]|uniref:Uncharacterized protein n=1 Tax=Mycena belliarum TaxID=1033014 RepID=A0AAD6TZZ8_9AGAR|nr:hypothetical protein B0H15DRAFT_931850 [Mycena belliae]
MSRAELAGKTPEKVEVLEFSWKGDGIAVYDFKSKDDLNYEKLINYNAGIDSSFKSAAAKIYENSMITGPMGLKGVDAKLTDFFWQYAIIKQAAISKGLEYKHRYSSIYCSSVPVGASLDAERYAQGQEGNAHFAARLAKLQDPKYKPKDKNPKSSILNKFKQCIAM